MRLWMLSVMFALVAEDALTLIHRCPRIKQFEEAPWSQNVTFFDFCSCQKNVDVDVTCEVRRNEELPVVLSFLSGFFVDQMTIKSNSPLTLKKSVFRGLHIRTLTFKNVRFDTLALFSAVTGLEFELEELRLINCKIENWVWRKGMEFVHLKTLIFDKTNLPAEMSDDSLGNFPSKIRNLVMRNGNLRLLGEKAFGRFPHLEKIDLEGNHLRKVTRGMFPRPTRRLRHLSLARNPIKELPGDLFQNMDRLEFLQLSSIGVSSLSNETFFPVWKQLEEIYLNDVKLKCDCKVAWMLVEETEASVFRKPYCSSHNRQLEEIKHLNEICPAGR